MTDRLSLTNALADANIDRQKAERIATEIFDAIHDNVATKADLQALEQRMLLRFAETDARIDRVVIRLGGLMVALTGLLFAALHYWPSHVHYLFHAHAWTPREVCYLQDLYVDPAARRSGVGGKLIEAVAAIARRRGCLRLYWTTKEDNAAARSLYDRIAKFNGFIRYDYALE